MAVIVEALPSSEDELSELVYGSRDHIAKSLSKLFKIWEERGRKGFQIDDPGELVTLEGPDRQNLTVVLYKYPDDYAVGIVAVEYRENGDQYARILAAGAHRNHHEIDQILKRGRERLREWVKEHGTLQ